MYTLQNTFQQKAFIYLYLSLLNAPTGSIFPQRTILERSGYLSLKSKGTAVAKFPNSTQSCKQR